MAKEPIDRRRLGRALSGIANASVMEALARAPDRPGSVRRIGVTGPPGAGKSTLISRFARRRLDRGATVGVVAVDPTSPYTSGAILGDRIRMERVSEDPRLYIRSLASRGASDGLADNIADILSTMDGFSFDEVILETVGVGQAEYAVRTLVDTLVLVLIPESGDQVQAMKAGMLETADVYVVNKADLPGAERIASELNAVTKLRRRANAAWDPPVILVSPREDTGLVALDEAVSRHLAVAQATHDPAVTRRQRIEDHLKSLIARRVSEILAADGHSRELDLRELFGLVAERLGAPADRGAAPEGHRRLAHS